MRLWVSRVNMAVLRGRDKSAIDAMQYDGPISIELQNPQLWQVPPRQFGEIAITSLRKLLGQSAMVATDDHQAE